ncbi:MAG: Ig-like domain-containing protein [Alphaproteobacteria bacterium]|nr:Ig-like domain-containing protein [Alphaproteobacteria bacterium]
MRNSLILTLIAGLAVVGCGEKEDSSADSVAPACEVEVDETFPAANATTAYYRGEIEFHLSDPDDTAEITVDGVSGTSWSNDEGDVIYFTPDAPLAPSTDYTATLSYCRGEAPISFRTSDLGTDIGDPSGLVGKTYDLDLQSGRIVIPEGVGSVLESYLEVTLFVSVLEADASNLLMFGAVANDDGTQDYCTQTLDFPEADFSTAPFFQIGPADTEISVAGLTVEIQQLLVSGTFAGDLSYWGGGVLEGKVDTRPLVDLVEEGGEENAICDIVAGFGVACETCLDGGDFCLSIRAIELGGDESSVALEVIEQSDCHENCADVAEDCDR